VSTSKGHVLFDAGITRRSLYARLGELGVAPSSLDAVVVSHEHSDHVQGLLSLLRHQKSDTQRRKPLPVFLNQRTRAAIDWKSVEAHVEVVEVGRRFQVADIEIDTFTIPHDAADPMAFSLQAEGHRFGLLTDLGYVPESVKVHLRGCEFLLLESNHDLEMLKVGPYPWSVKQRVMGRNGHLSNEAAATFVAKDLEAKLRMLVLGHLSSHNNHPAIARVTMESALRDCPVQPQLEVVEQGGPIRAFVL
jgi:phosphoribosyl 1,2-cyclic phosphodiesterase